MDIGLINAVNVAPNANQPAPQTTAQTTARADNPVKVNSEVDVEQVKVAAVESGGDLPSNTEDKARYEQVKSASAHYFKDFYAVSDATFTIFKDANGQYVTRFTNLRDGSVKYVPEPDIARYMEARSRAREALLDMDA